MEEAENENINKCFNPGTLSLALKKFFFLQLMDIINQGYINFNLDFWSKLQI